MEYTPFTLAEATDVWDDFEDLKDTEFKVAPSSVFLVHDVLISPSGGEDKNTFMANYLAEKDAGRAREFYSGDQYDVILFAAHADNDEECKFIDIRTFAAGNGINYNFPC
jgi:hypothetical protein